MFYSIIYPFIHYNVLYIPQISRTWALSADAFSVISKTLSSGWTPTPLQGIQKQMWISSKETVNILSAFFINEIIFLMKNNKHYISNTWKLT